MSEDSTTEQSLRKQRDDLELLNQLMRHDIRNDLQLVQAYAEMLDDHVDETGEEYLRIIKDNTKHAVELTTTVGQLATVMLRETAPTTTRSLPPVLTQQVEECRTAYPEAVVTLDGSLPQVTVTADSMLNSVFRNILRNAVKHNDKTPPEVRVSATTEDDTAVVRIADNGPGIPEDRKDRVFGQDEKGLDSPGAGIGLYLVKSLVTTYGGDVWIEDNEPTGAVFLVRLPVADSE